MREDGFDSDAHMERTHETIDEVMAAKAAFGGCEDSFTAAALSVLLRHVARLELAAESRQDAAQ